MLRLLRTVIPKPKPAVALPRRCRWECVPIGGGRVEWAIVCPPDGTAAQPWPALYLLHGSGHAPQSYFALLSTERLLPIVSDLCLVFVDGQKGWYLDSPIEAENQREQAFLRTLEAVERRFPAGRARENRGICGFSMGGFGAMRLATRHPDKFASASSILGPLDIGPLWPEYPALRRLLGTDSETWQEHNPAAHVERLARVRLMLTTADGAWDRPLNESFAAACRSHGVDAVYRQYPGEHGTDFVAERLAEHLEFHVRALGSAKRWEIRPMRMDDADALHQNCFSKMSNEETAQHLAWSVAEAARGRHVHLVVDNGEAVANGELSITGDRAEIANLVVRASEQGRGLGTALIRALTEAAQARDVRTLEIGVRSADARTRALYEGQGFSFFREALRPIDGESVPITYLQKQIQAKTDEHI